MCCVIMVVIFMGLGREQSFHGSHLLYLWDVEENKVLREVLKSLYGRQATKGWNHILWRELTP